LQKSNQFDIITQISIGCIIITTRYLLSFRQKLAHLRPSTCLFFLLKPLGFAHATALPALLCAYGYAIAAIMPAA
jgi:hypothetical protein